MEYISGYHYIVLALLVSYEEYFVPAFSSLHICAAGIYRCITIFGDILPERFEESWALRGVHGWLPLHRPCALRGVHVRYSLLCFAAPIYAPRSMFTSTLAPSTRAPPHGYGVILLGRVEQYIVGYTFGMEHLVIPVQRLSRSSLVPRGIHFRHALPCLPVHIYAAPGFHHSHPSFSITATCALRGVHCRHIPVFLRRLHLPEQQADELTTAEELLTDESRIAVEWFTYETATAEELHSDEVDELTTDASQIMVLPSSLTKPNTGMCLD